MDKYEQSKIYIDRQTSMYRLMEIDLNNLKLVQIKIDTYKLTDRDRQNKIGIKID